MPTGQANSATDSTAARDSTAGTVRSRRTAGSPRQGSCAGELQKLAFSADEVAELLGISPAHVWKLASTGRLPKPVRLGRAVRWDRKTLEAWLAAGAPPRDRWESMRSSVQS